ncbi:calcineurin-like phosphoesterase family protein [Kribbella voronezhensis]|uniref:Calcineurin-like phosphoesterase family protein n=1 Tax=Kribbella voronezhensis TaxID=2512212 RepID=A0A4R7T539_9ACTN|nr:metallophosphoesterase [Kribbella voronezhensis]TDU86755.1 calcineurin-like phosphoesterase family protein [Kribbella voronezhensis]
MSGPLLTRSRLRRAAPWAGLVVLWVVVSVAVGLLGFVNDSERVTIGAHAAEVSPTFDGHATLDLGAVLPRLRLKTDLPGKLGVNLDVQETDADNLTDLLNRDALIASQPDGEIARIRRVIYDMAVDNAVAGAGSGLLVAVVVATAWAMVGPRRRRELFVALHSSERRVRHRAVVVLVAMLVTIASIFGPGRMRAPEIEPTTWKPLASLLPEVSFDERLKDVEVAAGFSTTGGVGVIRTAVQTYERSTRFYGQVLDKVSRVGGRIHQAAEGETVALLVSDRHDNIGMDPIAAEVGKVAGAKVLIDAGDDSSSGQTWEGFSINSLAQHFKGFKVVAVAGNHDAGGYIENEMRKHKFTVLDSKPVEVEGIRFLGDSDPTRTGLGSADSPGDETTEEQSKRLADVACDQPEDKPISTMVVHDPSSFQDTANRGCASLLLSGHLHRQVGPDTKVLEGRAVTTYTNSTTGGAAYAFALGYTLRRPGEVTLITYEQGKPTGLQTVTVELNGEITVGTYRALPADTGR